MTLAAQSILLFFFEEYHVGTLCAGLVISHRFRHFRTRTVRIILLLLEIGENIFR